MVTSQVRPALIPSTAQSTRSAPPTPNQRASPSTGGHLVIRLARELPRVLQMRFQSPRVHAEPPARTSFRTRPSVQEGRPR